MGAALELGVDLLVFAAFVVSLASLLIYRATAKKLLLFIADELDKVNIPTPFGRKHLFGTVSHLVRQLANGIDAGLTSAVRASDGAAAYLWNQLARQVKWLGHFLGDLTTTLEAKFGWFLLVFPPAALLVGAVEAARRIPAILSAIHRLENRAVTTTTKIVHDAATVPKVVKTYVTRVVYPAAIATVGAVAAPLPWVRGRLGGIERDLGGLRKRVGALEKVGIGAGIAAAVAVALSRLGLGWVRCPRVTKAGRQVCGMNADLLDSLLADTLLIAGTVSLVEFAQGMQGITAEITPAIRAFWRAT